MFNMSKSMLFIFCLPVILLVVHSFFKWLDFQTHKNLLLIGILSAQNNFNLRDVLRNTWLKNLPKDVSYYFVLGSHACSIPLEDRVDEYSCEESYINLSDESDELLQSGLLECSDGQERKEVFWGYNFITLHDVVIHKFGIMTSLLRGSVRITLQEAASREVVTSLLMPSEPNNSDVLWASTDVFLLPKGFEGRVIVEKNFSSERWYHCGFNWASSGGLLQFHYLFNSPDELPSRFTSHTFSPVALGFRIQDSDELRELLLKKQDRQKSWNESVSKLHQDLDAEAAKMGDIVFVDVVDVYRNLPQKMLLFIQWLHYNAHFSFFLKTDDDTFINVPLVEKQLRRRPNTLNSCEEISWWSSFRVGWPIQTYGKWRENSFQSVTYPPFPCGSGYVLSCGAVRYLGINADNLYKNYQGEDVSLGIWLAGVRPSHVQSNFETCVWNCGSSSVYGDVCNYAELSGTHEGTLDLIEKRTEIDKFFTGRRGTAREGWKEVAAALTNGAPPISCKKKWENLCTKYKAIIAPRTGVSVEDGPLPTEWPYFEAMHKYMGDKDTIYPLVLIDTGTKNLVRYPMAERQGLDSSSNNASDGSATASCSTASCSTDTSSSVGGSASLAGSPSSSRDSVENMPSKKRRRRDSGEGIFREFLEEVRRQHRENMGLVSSAVNSINSMETMMQRSIDLQRQQMEQQMLIQQQKLQLQQQQLQLLLEQQHQQQQP